MQSRTTGLVLALVLGAASVGFAQQPGHNPGHRDGKLRQEWQGRGQQRGHGMLLQGITLSEQQKSQLQALRTQQNTEGRVAERTALREQMQAARAANDTPRLRELRTQQVTRMQQHREEMFGQIRAILTPAQQEVFDRNVAEAKARFEQRGDKTRAGKGRHAS